MSYCALRNTQQLLRPFREQVDCLTSIARSVESVEYRWQWCARVVSNA